MVKNKNKDIMVYNKNKDDDEHYDIKEHYDEDSFKASDIPFWGYLGMIAALFLLFAFGMWLKSRFFPTDKTKTIVSDNTETVKVTGDFVYSNGVNPPIGVARTASTTVTPQLGVSRKDALAINYLPPGFNPHTQILKMNPDTSKSFIV